MSFTLTQACGSRGCTMAARRVSLRAAVPFMGVISSGDLATYIGVVLFILFIASLVHREIKRSRRQSRKEDGVVRTERDVLEKRIAERTRELITAETERPHELNRTAEFGKLSQGLFHDLISPLTSISLYIEKLGTKTQESKEGQEIVGKVIEVSKRMNSYMESVRHCIGNAQELSNEIRAEMKEELEILRDILRYKVRMAGVTLVIIPCETIYLPIHPVRLHQLLLNLTSNAIDACTEAKKADLYGIDHKVTVQVSRADDVLILTVRDNGCGMSQDQTDLLFKKSFTTKEKGSGIGLQTVKSIVKDDLHGSIVVESQKGTGTTFTITVPLVQR